MKKLFFCIRDQAAIFMATMAAAYISYKCSHYFGYVQKFPMTEQNIVGYAIVYIFGSAYMQWKRK
ncbi:MAG TPA: hypothetical protein VKR54_02425 [Candidatus Babeliales bacterium]|jgi:hypothetical protein|nr:hypothetical protein [Candidatus Babeliales bacterium]